MLLEAIKKDNVYLIYFKHVSSIPDPALNEFLSLDIDEENYTFLWEDTFDKSIDIVAKELSKIEGIGHIAIVNTEAEIYKRGKNIGYSTPVIYRMEIVCSENTHIYIRQ